jgi:hypothetical protein
MAFGRSTRGEKIIIDRRAFAEEMKKQGWCTTIIPIRWLDELEIPHTATEAELLRLPKGTLVYAPVWVVAVWMRAPVRTDWSILKPRLVEALRNQDVREMVCLELELDPDAPPSARQASRNYLACLRRGGKIDDDTAAED